jgi:hypothetical protein
MLNALAIKIDFGELDLAVVGEGGPAHMKGAVGVEPIQYAIQIEVLHQSNILNLGRCASIDGEYAIKLAIENHVISADMPIPSQRAAHIVISA